jgi:1-acylglycerone phosphate reductase
LTDTLDMELRPLGLRVLLIAPGMIRSNIATNQTAAWAGLSEGSLYAAFRPSIEARLSVSQGAHSTPSDVFSRAVVDAALAPTPPRYLSLGTSSWTAYLATWVPRSLRLDQAWSMYSKITASA